MSKLIKIKYSKKVMIKSKINKVVILAGGYGTRISEETISKPKPMVEIGGKPILWHIMKIYSHYGINDFIICCGYKGDQIKKYFKKNSSKTKNMKNKIPENWKITFVDTGLNTMTGGRLKKVYKYLKNEKAFYFTYGDGVSNVNIFKLTDFHFKHNKLSTVTAIIPKPNYGILKIGSNNIVSKFEEKPTDKSNWVNGGFFILNPKVIKLIKNSKSIWEKDQLPLLAKKGELYAYKHKGFWKCMDTLRDKIFLNELWKKNLAVWKNWNE